MEQRLDRLRPAERILAAEQRSGFAPDRIAQVLAAPDVLTEEPRWRRPPFGFANRQTIAQAARSAIEQVLGRTAAAATRQVYDIAHNVAKVERHGGRELLVHHKGDARVPSRLADVPAAYRDVGQPVFIPGGMGTASFVLAGEPGSLARSFGTTRHGAGRALPRTAGIPYRRPASTLLVASKPAR